MIVKGLDWPRDKIIAPYQPLLVILVFLVYLANLSVFFIVGNGGKIKRKYRRSLFEKNADIFLKIVHSKLFAILLLALFFLLANFGLGIYFRLATRHETFFLVQRAAIFNFRVVLSKNDGT